MKFTRKCFSAWFTAAVTLAIERQGGAVDMSDDLRSCRHRFPPRLVVTLRAALVEYVDAARGDRHAWIVNSLSAFVTGGALAIEALDKFRNPPLYRQAVCAVLNAWYCVAKKHLPSNL